MNYTYIIACNALSMGKLIPPVGFIPRSQRDAGPELQSYYLQTNFISILRVLDRCLYG